MKILWLTIDRSNRVMQHFEQFRKAVAKKVEVTTIRKDTQGLLAGKFSRKLFHGKIKAPSIFFNAVDPNEFDFIFCDSFFAYIGESWEKVKTPSGILIEDVHDQIPKWQVEQAKEKSIDIIFHRYNSSFHEYHPNAHKNHKCVWLPFAVDPDFFKPLKNKKYQVMHTGSTGKEAYPFRNKIIEALKDKDYFTWIKRPKEVKNIKDKQWPYGKDYAKILGSSLIHPTGCSKYKVATCKYFEIAASGCLLMTNYFDDLDKLGFEHGETCLIINKFNMVKAIEVVKHSEFFLNYIPNNARQLIIDRHTLDIRANEFLEYIK